MSSIQGVGNAGIPPVNRPQATAASAPSAAPKRAADRLEITGQKHLLGSLKRNDIRADRVADVRAQIESGKYEDDKKLDAAIERLLDELNG